MGPTEATESASGARHALSWSNTGASSCSFHLYASKKLQHTVSDGRQTVVTLSKAKFICACDE